MELNEAEDPYKPVERFYAPGPNGEQIEISREEAEDLVAMGNELRSMEETQAENMRREQQSQKIQAELNEISERDAAVAEAGVPAETIEFVLSGGKRTEEQPEKNYVDRSPQSEEMDLSFLEDVNVFNDAVGDRQTKELNEHVMRNVLPDQMSEDEFEAYKKFAETGELPDEFPEEMLNVFKGIDNAQAVAKSVNRRVSKKLAEGVGDTIEWGDAQNIVEAHSEFYKSKRGWLETIGHKISIPQEILTRNAVVLAEKAKLMTTEQAKDFLSHDSLYPSDLVNFYIDRGNTAISGVDSFANRDKKGQASAVESGGRLLTGLAADIFLDPLTYMTGGLSAIGKIAKYAGKTKDVSKVSKAERVWIRNAESLEKIVSSDGAVKNVAAVKESIEAVSKGKISIQDFNINTGATPATRKEIYKAVKNNPEEMTMGEKWATGYNTLKFGYRIPFTKTAREIDVGITSGSAIGGTIGFLGAGPVGAGVGAAAGAALSYGALPRMLSHGFNIPKKVLLNMDGGLGMATALASFTSKTGKHVFDSSLTRFYGDAAVREKELALLETKQREFYKQIEKSTSSPEEFERVLKAAMDDMEMRPFELDEFAKTGKKAFEKDPGRITTTSQKYNENFSKTFVGKRFSELKDHLGEPTNVRKTKEYTAYRYDRAGSGITEIVLERNNEVFGRISGFLPSRGDPYGSIIGAAVHPDYRGMNIGLLLYDNMAMNGVNLSRGNMVSKAAKKTRLKSIETFSQPIRHTKEFERLTGISKADLERDAILSSYDGLYEKIDELRGLYEQGANLFRERGIPFQELSAPNGPLEARRYAKHMLTKQHLKWVQKQSEAGEEVASTLDYLAQNNKNMVARTEAGRKYRGTINDANQAALKDPEKAHKIYVDDPIELATARYREMHKIAKLHDAFKAAENYAMKTKGSLGGSWKKFELKDFDDFLLESVDEISDAAEIERKIKSYLPKYFQSSEKIYLPYDVYDRLLYLAKGDESLKNNFLVNGYSTMMSIFKQNALMGLAYQGLNAAGNAMQYITANGVDGVTSGARALALMMSPKGFDKFIGGLKVVNDDGVEVILKAEDLIAEAHKFNLFQTGASQELKFSQLADSVASNRGSDFGWSSPVKKIGQEISNSPVLSTIGEAATFWRTNKWVAEKMDLLPKLGTYINRRQRGFSAEAAAEAADRYFYSYNMAGKNQNRLGQTIPFSKFAFKTLEHTLEQVKNHELADLIMPDKVRRAMIGDYVEDPETREWLNQNVPQYHWVNSPTWGTVFPGQRAIIRSYPWAINTLNMFFNPQEDINPVTKMLGLTVSTFLTAKDEDLSGYQEDQFKKELQRSAEMLIPPPILNAMQIMDLNNDTFGGFFAKNFEPALPTEAEFISAASKPGMDNPKVQMYLNSVEFGEAFVDNFLYKKLWGEPESGEALASTKDQRTAAKGEYIRRKMRQFLLGQASMTKVDQNFFFRQGAMKRQRNQIESQIRARMNETRAAVNDNDLTYLMSRGAVDPESVAERMPEIYKLMQLDNLMKANRDGYEFLLEHEFKQPDLDLGELLFGVSEKQIKDNDGSIDYDELTAKPGDFDPVSAQDRGQQIWDKLTLDASAVDAQLEQDEPEEDDYSELFDDIDF